jgi:hypothetical protein
MTKKEFQEVMHLMHANGVPPLVYKWNYSELEAFPILYEKVTPILEDIDSFIRGHQCLYFYFDKNPVLASQVAATFLKRAYTSGYLLSRYTRPDIIADYKAESWDNGDAYNELLKADFLVIDKVGTRLDDFKDKTFEEFVEDRLFAERSTIFVGVKSNVDALPSRIQHILKALKAIEIREKTSVPIC